MKYSKSFFIMLISVLLMSVGISKAEVFSAETSQVGGAGHTVTVAMSVIAKNTGTGEIQIQDGQTLTKSGINLALRKSDIVTIPNAVYNLMSRGVGPYSKMGKEKSSQMAGEIQALFGFVGAIFLPMTFQDSGIETWADFKGKKVFVGPPKGAAAVNAINLIKTVTGYEPGVDYEELRFGWGAAQQAMLDRKIDVMIRTATEPSPLVQQLISAGDIRIFGAPKEIVNGPEWTKFTTKFGGQGGSISTKTYPTGVEYVDADGDRAHTFLATFFLGVNKNMPEETAYQLTKMVYSNMEQVYGSGAFMRNLRIEEGVFGMAGTPGLKLHAGAIRAHEENGLTIPAQFK